MFTGENLAPRIRDLYRKIDSAYAAAAKKTGLTCEGCNGVICCSVDLFLHTFIEISYLRLGFKMLEPSLQSEIRTKSRWIVDAKCEAPYGASYRSAVCALNFAGACILYESRPMICRLAGIPHVFTRPDGSEAQSGGCKKFEETLRAQNPEAKIDRSAFYREMAAMEIEAVRARGRRTEKLTVSEALVGGKVSGEPFFL
jgi:hypothetical protein